MSPLAVELAEESVLRRWAEQAPRKLWLTRPGDVLITPVPFTAPCRRYVFHLLGVPENSVDVITVPDTPYLPMAQALAEHNLLEPLRALVAERRPLGCFRPRWTKPPPPWPQTCASPSSPTKRASRAPARCGRSPPCTRSRGSARSHSLSGCVCHTAGPAPARNSAR
ncbi:hypothetical protein ACIF6I_01935 [Streptomyces microflavus]|uniref:preATP grasp domain-containing protein n=1 Tax=Streptomyces microflavus TaxID=1919 RepID=UPI0037CF9EAA